MNHPCPIIVGAGEECVVGPATADWYGGGKGSREEMVSDQKQKEKLCKLKELVQKEISGEEVCGAALEDALWDMLVLLEGRSFETAKHLDYSYSIKGYEIFVSRKDKSITRSTVNLSLWNAMELQKAGLPVSGPKKLKTFGASYLYPIFQEIGVIVPEETEQLSLELD